MAYSDKYELGDRVWYEAEDGNRYLMVVKELGSSSLALYPLRDTRLMLKDTSESTYNYITLIAKLKNDYCEMSLSN